MSNTKHIVFTGPECCGKTTWSEWFSQKTKGFLTTEFAREYLSEIGGDYGFNTLTYIAEEQYKIIDNALKQNVYVISDTDVLTIKIWSKVKYGKVDDTIFQLNKISNPNLYILCYPDIPWEQDGLRENPTDRLMLLDIYIREIEKKKIPYCLLKGNREQKEAILTSLI